MNAMNRFFCANNSRELEEDMIGTATKYETYILVECPTPWGYEAFNSKWVPDNLKVLVTEVEKKKLPMRFLLIANDETHRVKETTLLIYQQQEGLSNGYKKQEFKLPNIELVAGVINKWLAGITSNYEVENHITRDILICTHGSHDQCCARYGNPFYFHGQKSIDDLQLENVRMWRSSHFGGHRFAPTMIDLPQGRYYGRLDQNSLIAILTHQGNIEELLKVYRGWGILPNSLQVLERELMLQLGWDWFNYQLKGKILEQSLDNNTILSELSFGKPGEDLYTYQAKLIKDNLKTKSLKSSCNAEREVVFVKYTVANLWLISHKVVTTSSLV